MRARDEAHGELERAAGPDSDGDPNAERYYLLRALTYATLAVADELADVRATLDELARRG